MSKDSKSAVPKHTPGPYKMRRRHVDSVVEIYPEFFGGEPNTRLSKMIAQVSTWAGGGPDYKLEAEANLQLFLHAPETAAECERLTVANKEMLEACEAALEFFDSGPIQRSRENVGLVAKLRHIVSPHRG